MKSTFSVCLSTCLVGLLTVPAIGQEQEYVECNHVKITAPADEAVLPFSKFTVTIKSAWGLPQAWVELYVNGKQEGAARELTPAVGGQLTRVDMPVSTDNLHLGENEIYAISYYIDPTKPDNPQQGKTKPDEAMIHVMIVPNVDLDGREPDPDKVGALRDVPEVSEEDPGVLLADKVTTLAVQNPGGEIGFFTLTWKDPAGNKKLKLNAEREEYKNPAHFPCVGPWPIKFVVSTEGKWDATDTADVKLTYSESADFDTVKLVMRKVYIKRDEAGGAVDYQLLTDATREVLPGQQMNLKAEVRPVSSTVAAWQWTLPGVVFKDYTANENTGTLTPLAATDSDGQTVRFYWADTGDGRKVVCKAKIGGQWVEGYEMLNVKNPKCKLSGKMGGKVKCDYPRFGLLGDKDWKTGITLTGDVSVPTGFSKGIWQFVQTVVPNSWRRDNWDGKVQLFSYSKNGQSCGDGYPIGGPWNTETGPHAMQDAPFISLVTFYWQVESKQDDFATYVMFRPPGEGSKWVPLKFVTWWWKGLVENAGFPADANWSLVSGDQGASSAKVTSSHPQWVADESGTWVQVP